MSVPHTHVLDALADIQQFLNRQGLDGWLLYDWHGNNRIAQSILGTKGLMLTRRVFYWIPARGGPVAIVPLIESNHLPEWPGHRREYSSWIELRHHLEHALKKSRIIAMEYSPRAEVPSVSLVDAGTVELIQSLQKQVVSSAELVLRLNCVLNGEQIAAHRRAAQALTAIKDEAFQLVREFMANDQPITEKRVAEFILSQYQQRGLICDSGPIVACGRNAGKPHYTPPEHGGSVIEPDKVLLLDMWAKEQGPHGIYADISWMAFTGQQPSSRIDRVLRVVLDARDLAVEVLRNNHMSGQVTLGCEIDEAVRNFINDAGWGTAFIHRTGHNIGGEVHGDGTHIDNWETKDTRPLIPGLCFSIEPGIYLADFGVRSEIDVLMTEQGPEVTTPPQRDWVLLR